MTTSGADFTVSDRSGDINPGSLEGFYSSDTRFLSEFRLRVGGKPPSLLGSSPINHRLASFYLSTDATHSGTRKGISVVRDRYVDRGLHEDISIFNHTTRDKRVVVSMTFNADFADLFQVRRQTVVKAGEITVKKHRRDELRFVYRRKKYKREVRIHFSETPRIDGRRVSFSVILAPRDSWKVCVSVTPVLDEAPSPMQCVADFLGAPFTTESPAANRELPRGWANSISFDPAAPAIDTARPNLRKVYDAAVADLASLTLNYEDGRVYAAGLPWFIAIFGRDSIFSANWATGSAPSGVRPTETACTEPSIPRMTRLGTPEILKRVNALSLGSRANGRSIFNSASFALICSSVTSAWSMLTAKNCTLSLLLNFSRVLATSGIFCRQKPHQVAQKSNTTTLPCNDSAAIFLPSASETNSKSEIFFPKMFDGAGPTNCLTSLTSLGISN